MQPIGGQASVNSADGGGDWNLTRSVAGVADGPYRDDRMRIAGWGCSKSLVELVIDPPGTRYFIVVRARPSWPHRATQLAFEDRCLGYRIAEPGILGDMIPELLGLLESHPRHQLIPVISVLTMH